MQTANNRCHSNNQQHPLAAKQAFSGWICLIAPGLLAACLTGGGCAKLPTQLPQPPIADVHPQYKQRVQEGVRAFEQKRDFAQYQAAISRFNQHDHAGCRDLLERLLQRNAHHLPSLLLLAELKLLNQQPAEAQVHLDHALTLYPNHAAVHHALGQAKEACGEHQEAIVHFERALELAPKSTLYLESLQSAHEDQGQAARAVAFNHTSGPAVANTVLKQQLTAQPKSPPLQPFAAEIQEWLDGGAAALADNNPRAAAECFHRAMDAEPHNPRIASAAALQALESSQPDLAVAMVERGLAHSSQSGALFSLLGTARYRLGQLEPAEAAFKQAVHLDNTHAVSYFLLGCTQSKLGRHQDAQWNLERARTLNPRYVLGK